MKVVWSIFPFEWKAVRFGIYLNYDQPYSKKQRRNRIRSRIEKGIHANVDSALINERSIVTQSKSISFILIILWFIYPLLLENVHVIKFLKIKNYYYYFLTRKTGKNLFNFEKLYREIRFFMSIIFFYNFNRLYFTFELKLKLNEIEKLLSM